MSSVILAQPAEILLLPFDSHTEYLIFCHSDVCHYDVCSASPAWVFGPGPSGRASYHKPHFTINMGKEIKFGIPLHKKRFDFQWSEVLWFCQLHPIQNKGVRSKSGSWVNHTVMAHFPVFRQKLLEIMWESPGNPYIVPKVCDDFLHVNSSWARPLDRLCFIMRQNKNDNNRQKTSPFICWEKKP